MALPVMARCRMQRGQGQRNHAGDPAANHHANLEHGEQPLLVGRCRSVPYPICCATSIRTPISRPAGLTSGRRDPTWRPKPVFRARSSHARGMTTEGSTGPPSDATGCKPVRFFHLGLPLWKGAYQVGGLLSLRWRHTPRVALSWPMFRPIEQRGTNPPWLPRQLPAMAHAPV